MTRDRKADAAAIGAIALSWALFHADVLAGGVYYFRDIYHYHVPIKTVAAQAIAAGEAPLWNPYVGCGQPLLANPNNVAVHPFNVLYRLAGVPRAVTLYIALHRLVLPLGAYALARFLELGPGGSLLAALLLGFSGLAASIANFYITVGTAAWSPLAILALLRALDGVTPRRIAAAAAAWALVYLGGEPFTMLMTLGLALVLALARGRPRSTVRLLARFVLIAATVGAATLALCAITVLPTAELLRSTRRGEGYAFGSYAMYSMPPLSLAEMVVPNLLGQPWRLERGALWGASRFENGFPYFLSLYMGAGAWVLALCGSWRRQRRRWQAILWTLVGASLVLALGRHVPGNAIAFALAPPLWLLRYPVKWTFVTSFGLSLLAGRTWESISDRTTRSAAARRIACAVFGVLLAALGLARPEPFARAVASLFPPVPGGIGTPDVCAAIGTSMTRTGLLWIAIAAAVELAARGIAAPRIGLTLVVVLCLCDLHGATSALDRAAPASFYDAGTKAAAELRSSHPWTPRIAEALGPRPDAGRVLAPDDDRRWHFYWLASVLKAYTGIPHGLRYAFDDDPAQLHARTTVARNSALAALPPADAVALLADSAVEYVLSLDDVAAAGTTVVARVESSSDRPLVVRRVVDAKPWAGVEGGGPARPLSLTPNRFVFEASARTPSRFVLRETFFPGWRATVAGRAVPIERYAETFMSVPIAAGQSRVELRFDPASYRIGRAVSLATLALLLLALLAGARAAGAAGAATAPAARV
ncbi:MAG: YfhO family protein [Acidobacteriota bacterium]